MASSQRYPPKQQNDLTTAEKFLNDVNVVAHDLKESKVLKTKAMVDTVRTMNRAKYGVLRDLKKSDNRVLTTLIDIELAKLEAIKSMKLTFLNMLSTQIDALVNEIESNDVTDILDSPIFDFVAEMMVPLLSGVNSEKILKKMAVTENNFSVNSFNSNSVSSNENSRTPVTGKDAPEKFSLMSMEPLFKESLSTSSKESSVRKILKL